MKLILSFLLLSLSTIYGAGLTPDQLECEARSNPLGIDTQDPRFSWKLESDHQGDAQTAYEILVATSPDKLTEVGTIPAKRFVTSVEMFSTAHIGERDGSRGDTPGIEPVSLE